MKKDVATEVDIATSVKVVDNPSLENREAKKTEITTPSKNNLKVKNYKGKLMES